MIYLLIAAAVFGMDDVIKNKIDKNYELKMPQKRCGGKIEIEKFYNQGAVLNLLARHPNVMTAMHSIVLAIVAVIFYFCLKRDKKMMTKLGLALLLGGGFSNLYDRYTKHHVVDYIRFQVGPKWFRKIIFNSSDFFVFLGALLAVMGSESD